MDVLRRLSPDAFTDSAKFKKPPVSCKHFDVRLIKIECDHQAIPQFNDVGKISETKLKTDLAAPTPRAAPAPTTTPSPAPASAPSSPPAPPPAPAPAPAPAHTSPSLQLVVIDRGGDDDIDMAKERFLELFDDFDIDPIILQQIAYSSYGFHHYDEPYRGTYSFYIGTYVFALAWSFNPATMKTNAILLLRNTPVLRHGTLALTSIQKTLNLYSRCIHSPFFLLFVVFVNLCRMSQYAIYTIVNDLRSVETLTGHGPGNGPIAIDKQGYTQPTIDKLSRAAQNVANTQVHIANLVRHDAYIKDMAQYLEQPDLVAKWRDLAPADLATPWNLAFATLSPQVPPLKKLTSDLAPSLRYLETRAGCQSSVIRSMMTHEDARLGAELAEAARKDSSAMRSIAMMTMLFLPGAFFAAIFSIESLPNPAKEEFWIFWAFTLPSTILVFLVWRCHRWSQKKWEKYKKAKAESKEKAKAGKKGSVSDGSVMEAQNGKQGH
ncbi:hypothetical protein VD0004_g8586 [Verticillium dahliae]|uniref:Uncharacterized protein n=1 Tax=Verticillium dahliae TaxID=27337 RepID=A0A444RLS4_VERDA|nr:hypothetical protein VD0004_g8586 [Verticillium dahliae]PNH62068.1 hypothetical protein VD0001_g9558 [Verticillium dahliae]RXG42089.1 hypothetical protein VDGE_10053 [Verticillium dahliae]